MRQLATSSDHLLRVAVEQRLEWDAAWAAPRVTHIRDRVSVTS